MTSSPVGEEDKVIEAQVQSSEAEQAVRILRIEDDQNLAELVAEFLERKRDRFDVITEIDPRDGLEVKAGPCLCPGSENRSLGSRMPHSHTHIPAGRNQWRGNSSMTPSSDQEKESHRLPHRVLP